MADGRRTKLRPSGAAAAAAAGAAAAPSPRSHPHRLLRPTVEAMRAAMASPLARSWLGVLSHAALRLMKEELSWREMWPRYGRDVAEIWARCGRDMSEI